MLKRTGFFSQVGFLVSLSCLVGRVPLVSDYVHLPPRPFIFYVNIFLASKVGVVGSVVLQRAISSDTSDEQFSVRIGVPITFVMSVWQTCRRTADQ